MFTALLSSLLVICPPPSSTAKVNRFTIKYYKAISTSKHSQFDLKRSQLYCKRSQLYCKSSTMEVQKFIEHFS